METGDRCPGSSGSKLADWPDTGQSRLISVTWIYERKSEYGIYPSAVKLPNIEFEMSGKGCRCYYLPPRRNAPGENVDVWCCHILALSARISVAKEMKILKFSIPLTIDSRKADVPTPSTLSASLFTLALRGTSWPPSSCHCTDVPSL